MKKLLFSIFLIMMMIGGTASYAVNAPVLATDMTPLKYDTSSGEFVATEASDETWYNYEPVGAMTDIGNGV